MLTSLLLLICLLGTDYSSMETGSLAPSNSTRNEQSIDGDLPDRLDIKIYYYTKDLSIFHIHALLNETESEFKWINGELLTLKSKQGVTASDYNVGVDFDDAISGLFQRLHQDYVLMKYETGLNSLSSVVDAVGIVRAIYLKSNKVDPELLLKGPVWRSNHLWIV